MPINNIPGVGPTNADIATAVAAPSAATIASAVAAAVPTTAGITSIVQANAGGKTLKRLTLTGGSSYTVPAGVTFLNVTLVGGGGGGGVLGVAGGTNGGAGGTTTFTGATSATGGVGGLFIQYNAAFDYNGVSGTASTGDGGTSATQRRSDVGYFLGLQGRSGQIISSVVNTTGGSTISYSIGGGGAGGTGSLATASSGGVGGSGKIDIEYWS